MSVSIEDVLIPAADEGEIEETPTESWVAEQVRLLTIEEGFA